MLSRDEYQRKADNYVAQAELVRDPQEQAALRTIAQLFMALGASDERPATQLDQLIKRIAECYLHAEECAYRANTERNPCLREDFFKLQQHWLTLVSSYEFSERLDQFQNRWKR